jgi:hypothetical protein
VRGAVCAREGGPAESRTASVLTRSVITGVYVLSGTVLPHVPCLVFIPSSTISSIHSRLNARSYRPLPRPPPALDCSPTIHSSSPPPTRNLNSVAAAECAHGQSTFIVISSGGGGGGGDIVACRGVFEPTWRGAERPGHNGKQRHRRRDPGSAKAALVW